MPETMFEKMEKFRACYAGGDYVRPLLVCEPPTKSGGAWLGDYTLSDLPVTEWLPQIIENYHAFVKFSQQTGDDAVPVAKIMTGTHIYAAAFGCKVHQAEGDMPFALPLIRTANGVTSLEIPDISDTPVISRIFEMAEAVEKELGVDVPLSPPDIQTGFDTAALIWNKEDFMCAMVMEPKAVLELTAKCAEFLKKVLCELRKRFPQMQPCHCPSTVWCPPEMGWWVSNDECGCINEAMFEEFCLPELLSLSDTFGSIGMHCCADAEHQFAKFAEIPNFYGFNRVPGKLGWQGLIDSPLLGRDAPVAVLWVKSVEEVRQIMNRAPEGSRFIFDYNGEQSCAAAWIDGMHGFLSE